MGPVGGIRLPIAEQGTEVDEDVVHLQRDVVMGSRELIPAYCSLKKQSRTLTVPELDMGSNFMKSSRLYSA